jgi:pimeloyl-ACP methyl ester carboxylesterase
MLLAHELIGHAHDPAIVLIHGITDSRHAWHPLLHSLAAHHLVLAVDLRGHGEAISTTATTIATPPTWRPHLPSA